MSLVEHMCHLCVMYRVKQYKQKENQSHYSLMISGNKIGLYTQGLDSLTFWARWNIKYQRFKCHKWILEQLKSAIKKYKTNTSKV